MRVSQTRQELLDNTIAFYGQDTSRRAIGGGGICKYNTEDGKRCAIGRECKKGLLDNYNDDSLSVVMGIIPKRLQNMGRCFLRQIQLLHDNGYFWGKEKGLTEDGRDKAADIASRYGLDFKI